MPQAVAVGHLAVPSQQDAATGEIFLNFIQLPVSPLGHSSDGNKGANTAPPHPCRLWKLHRDTLPVPRESPPWWLFPGCRGSALFIGKQIIKIIGANCTGISGTGTLCPGWSPHPWKDLKALGMWHLGTWVGTDLKILEGFSNLNNPTILCLKFPVTAAPTRP